ncbi:uncharacterized protein LOC130677144 [Microplitis mediator]|uniref:uncharacterized protein LOC130677144 n=1 Tax=Microplitis mediator TaxID=375433 RepID=UPI002552E5A8|nr:uncharacterized protein LOC130677144 [Microplitis mediator]
MEKKIFCAVEGRNKCIKFVSVPGITDFEIIKTKINEICQRDVLLKPFLSTKIIIIQKKDLDSGIWCDVEEDDIIEDKEKLTILFLPSHNSTYIAPAVDHDNSSIQVLYTEPGIVQPDILSNTELIASELVTPVESVVISSESIDCLSNEDNSKSSCDRFQQCSNSGSPSREPHTLLKSELEVVPGPIIASASLPSLTYDLQNKLNEHGVLKIQAKLMHYWGSYLWQKTSGRPSKKDYQNFADAIIKVYPLLKGGSSENSIVRLQLSTWIRNHRCLLKKQETQVALKRDAHGEIIKPATSFSALTTSSETSESPKLDINRALVELEKKQGKEGNTPHVRRLLKLTYNARRLWIQTEAKSIFNIVEKYPHLKDCGSILNDFYQLKNTTAQVIEQEISEMFTKLKIFFRDEENTDFERTVLLKLYDRLTKKLKNQAKPLLTFQEARSSTDSLMAEEGESPRAVIYTENNKINSAFIVADNNIIVTIESPKTSKVVACLLAAYYVWDTKFPKPYLNVLQYIDNQVLGTSIKNNVVYKFIRMRDEAFV